MSHWPPGVPPKAELNAALRREHPWLADDRFGPRNVTAGDCERCGAEARLVQTCGPDSGEYGRRCATPEDWCDGHADEAREGLAYLAALPEDADDVAYLWWLSTGEIRGSSQQRGPLPCAPVLSSSSPPLPAPPSPEPPPPRPRS